MIQAAYSQPGGVNSDMGGKRGMKRGPRDYVINENTYSPVNYGPVRKKEKKKCRPFYFTTSNSTTQKGRVFDDINKIFNRHLTKKWL